MRQNSENSKMERWRKLIHSYRRIRFDVLIVKSHVSVGEYNKLKSFFEHRFEYELKYYKQSKEWVSLESSETEDAKVD
jgi:hypothetical protein